MYRHIVDKKQSSSIFKLNSDGTGVGKQNHSHDPMTPIECDIIMYINAKIDQYISENPSSPIKIIYDQKELEN